VKGSNLLLHSILHNGEERAVRNKICKFIRDTLAVLIQLRVLAGKLISTAAAVYGIYHAFVLLAK
jgi:hypothetical protein